MPAYKYTFKNGKTKWRASFYYTDWMGEKHKKCKRGFETKSAAKEYERLFLDKYSKSPTILFTSLASNYLDDLSTRLKPTTIENKTYIIESKLVPYFGKLQICKIDAEMIRHWQNELINYRNEQGKPYSETYLHTIHAQMSAVMNYAVRYYKLASNPCLLAGTIGTSRADEMNFWTREEFTHVMDFERKEHYLIAFKILFYSGIREGELLALTPEDISRTESVIDINKNYAVVKGVEYLLTPKTKRSIRKVTIPDTLHTEILEFLDGMLLSPDERIFYFGRNGINKELKRVTEIADEKRIRVHDLRHSHASMLISMGVQIEEISRRLGHDSIKTTWDTYSHLYPDADKLLADKIDVLLRQESVEKSSSLETPVLPEFNLVAGSPLSKVSQYILKQAEEQGNEHIQKNNRNIFSKYDIDIEKEEMYGFKLSSYLDVIAFGDSIIQIISKFQPDPSMKDFVLGIFSDAISTCEMMNGCIEQLDGFMTKQTIPKYAKLIK